jgi:predicted dehydrogenase
MSKESSTNSTAMADGGGSSSEGPAHVALVGAGSRGTVYAGLALEHPEWMKVVAVAEPRKLLRARLQALHAIPDDLAFEGWEQLVEAVGRRGAAALPGGMRLDACIIATQDREHAAPAIALCKLGFDILLEKPMAVDAESCRAIAAAAEEAGVIFSVCHVLRYMPLYAEAQRLLHGGAPELGRIKVSGETREESARAASKAGSCPQRLRWWRDTGPLRLMCGTFAHSPDDRPRGTRGALALGPLVRSRQLGELAPLVLLLHGQVVPRH